ncbi:type II toxin-antitoxin system TacA family antitoxin [Rheinheimera gaetbuli]
MATELRERIEMRVDAETKQLAERAAAALGCASLTEFMVRLIRDNAPAILQAQAAIKLTSAQFDQFIQVCESAPAPYARLKAAAYKLDKEGF